MLVPPKVTLASLRGKPAAINFWASWCSPCQTEAPELERVAHALHGRASLVGVDWTDGTGAARSFVHEHQLTYPILIDADGVVGQNYGLNGLPTTFILDAQGRITRRPAGAPVRRLPLARAGHDQVEIPEFLGDCQAALSPLPGPACKVS